MKNVKYLIEYARAQVGRPYWGGTYGKIASPELLAYKRRQYPALYPKSARPPFESQYGEKVHDCNGLVMAATVCDTPDSEPKKYPAPYYSVKGLRNTAADVGGMSDLPRLIDGCLLFRGNAGHVGIYDHGEVIHAKGHAWGVIKEAFSPLHWQEYGRCSLFEYEKAPIRPLAVGDLVRMDPEATVWNTSKRFSSWVYKELLWVMAVDGNKITVSVDPSKGITGRVNAKYLRRA